MTIIKKLAIFSIVISLFFPNLSLALSYNLNNLLSDNELQDYRSMSKARIQDFLQKKGTLGHYVTTGVNGALNSAAEVIYNATSYYHLSPKYFLVRIQVEQALVTDPSPSAQQFDRAAGYGCPDYSSCDPQYKGFFNQINQSAKAIVGEKYLKGIEENGHTISGWGPGITKTTLDGIAITPVNAATAVLYTYTPWVGKYGGGDSSFGGTSLFVKIWREWFTRRYPDGTLIQEEGQNGVFLIANGKKRPFRNKAALLANYDPGKIINVSNNEIDAYEEGQAIQFPDNVLLQSPKGTVYIVVGGKKRGITSQKVFQKLGFNPEEIIPVSWKELNSLPDGEPVINSSVFPTGILLQSTENGGVFYVENGIKHSIWSKEILKSRFKNQLIILASKDEINAYPQGEPIKFKDGEIVTTSGRGAVYFISNGQKRPFKNAEVFNAMGYRWGNIIHTTPEALAIHPTGKVIDL